MPIYEYLCEACGRRSSALLPRFDAPDPACSHCAEPRLRRLVSSFATLGGEDDHDDGYLDAADGDSGPGGGDDDFGDDDW